MYIHWAQILFFTNTRRCTHIHTSTYAYKLFHSRTWSHTHVPTYQRTQTHAHTHTHTHTHEHTHSYFVQKRTAVLNFDLSYSAQLNSCTEESLNLWTGSLFKPTPFFHVFFSIVLWSKHYFLCLLYNFQPIYEAIYTLFRIIILKPTGVYVMLCVYNYLVD